MRRPLSLLAALALLMLAAAGCGTEEPEAAAPELITITESRTVTAADPPAGADEPGAPAVTATATRAPAPAPAPEQGGIRVPNVVGEDHQLAQDTMQAAGLYNLAEEDATGQGRLLLWDRNWVVVSQSPPAGSVVPEDTTIILRSKKDDE